MKKYRKFHPYKFSNDDIDTKLGDRTLNKIHKVSVSKSWAKRGLKAK